MSELQPDEFAIFSNSPYGGFKVSDRVTQKIADWFGIQYSIIKRGDEEDEEGLLCLDHGEHRPESMMRGLGGSTYHRDALWCKIDVDDNIRLTNDPEVVQLIRTEAPHITIRFAPLDLVSSLEYREYDGSESIRPRKDLHVMHCLETNPQVKPLITQAEEAFAILNEKFRSSKAIDV